MESFFVLLCREFFSQINQDIYDEEEVNEEEEKEEEKEEVNEEVNEKEEKEDVKEDICNLIREFLVGSNKKIV